MSRLQPDARQGEDIVEVASFLQADEEQQLVKESGVLLLSLPFVILTALAIVALVWFPPTWSLAH